MDKSLDSRHAWRNPRRMNPAVDLYLSKPRPWREEMVKLRGILLESGLTEELKWGKPCYTLQGSNIVILQGFKESCAVLFAKGALLSDPEQILEKPGENTQGARRIRFTHLREIIALEPLLKAKIEEAIAAEKAGLKVEYQVNPEPIPDELQRQLEESPAFRRAFEGLTPGRQRAYILHFSAPKQSKTRTSRVEKCLPQILAGKGMND